MNDKTPEFYLPLWMQDNAEAAFKRIVTAVKGFGVFVFMDGSVTVSSSADPEKTFTSWKEAVKYMVSQQLDVFLEGQDVKDWLAGEDMNPEDWPDKEEIVHRRNQLYKEWVPDPDQKGS